MPKNRIYKSTDGRYTYKITTADGKRQILKSRKNESKKDFAARCEELDKTYYSNATLETALNFYLNKSKTSTGHKQHLKNVFNRYYTPLLELDIANITRPHVVQCLETSRLNKASLKYTLVALSSVCNFYLKYIDSPYTFTATKRAIEYISTTDTNQKHKEISANAYKSLLDAVELSEVRNYLIFLYETGMRPSEALGLKIEDIKEDFAEIKRARTRNGISQGKTETAKRLVPLSLIALQAVKDSYSKGKDFIFPSSQGYYADKLRKASKLIGTAFTLYDFRHTFASRLARENVNIKVLQQIMGHANANITLNYYVKANKKDLLSAVRK